MKLWHFAGIALLLLLATAGCRSMNDLPMPPPPAAMIDTVIAQTPVAIDCAPMIGEDPPFPDTRSALLAAPFPDAEKQYAENPMDATALGHLLENLRYRVQLLAAGWPMKNTRLREYRAALQACGVK